MGKLALKSRHRLICGDSTDASVVAKVMQSETANLCFTSPPYGNQRDYKTGGISDWDALMQGVFAQLPMAPDAQVLVNLGLIHRDNEWVPYWDGWIEWMRNHSWRRFGFYVWDQQRGLPGNWNGRLAPSHEFIFHFNREAVQPVKHVECNAERADRERKSVMSGKIKKGLRSKDGSVVELSSPDTVGQTHKIPDSVFRFERHMANDIARMNHPATFPVALPEHGIKSYSMPDDIVYEPFGGSGTTAIACEKTGRRCRLIELAPEYCDVIVKRWQAFTGQTAVLESTGEPFPG